MGGFCGYGGSVWVMGEWAVGYWIVGVTSFHKIYGLYGLKYHIVEIRGDDKHLKIELLSQWMLEADFCKYKDEIPGHPGDEGA